MLKYGPVGGLCEKGLESCMAGSCAMRVPFPQRSSGCCLVFKLLHTFLSLRGRSGSISCILCWMNFAFSAGEPLLAVLPWWKVTFWARECGMYCTQVVCLIQGHVSARSPRVWMLEAEVPAGGAVQKANWWGSRGGGVGRILGWGSVTEKTNAMGSFLPHCYFRIRG